jgi:hypothetical protein
MESGIANVQATRKRTIYERIASGLKGFGGGHRSIAGKIGLADEGRRAGFMKIALSKPAPTWLTSRRR